MLPDYFLVLVRHDVVIYLALVRLRKHYDTHLELDCRVLDSMSAMDTDEASVVLSSNTASGLSVSL
jgi:hypothetical protein